MHSAQVLLALSAPLASGLYCRPEGPVVPKPKALTKSTIFQSATAKLEGLLSSVNNGSLEVPWAVGNTSYSLAVVSMDQEQPIWEYHHLSPNNTNGTKCIGNDSQYLIGSISKVITDYALLKSGLDIEVPITKYLPELNTTSQFDWNSITLRMLGSQLAGVPVNFGFSEYYTLKEVFESLGFPTIPDSDYPKCGTTGLNGPCTAQDILDGMATAYPLAAPMEHPQYSNLAFNIIALAMERVTGKNYTETIQSLVSGPLGLPNTYPSPGDDSRAVIPPVENSWGSNYGLNAPGGGLVSSISDLSKFSHAILSRSVLSPTKIRQWLKPVSFAGSNIDTVGMPWEIVRSSKFTAENPHPVTIYGKGGAAQAYRSQLSIIDEYGVAFIVLTAGDMQAQPDLSNAMISTLLPAVDEESRKQANDQFSKTFQSSNGSVSITFKQDKGSLRVSSFRRGQVDLLENWSQIWLMTLGTFGMPVSNTVRLFPTEVTQNVTVAGKHVSQEMWRLWPESAAPPRSQLPGSELFKESCMTWMIGDWLHYGGEPLDRIVFYRDGKDIVGVELPFMRSGIMKPTTKE